MALKNISGLWINDKAGKKYMSGKSKEEIVIPAGARLMVFKNDRKETDKHPDYQLVVAEDDGGEI